MLGALYENIDDKTSDSSFRRPVIGISVNRKDGLSCIAEPYFQSVVLAGGAPVLLPVTTDIAALASVVENLDGLIFSGGGDIVPDFFGEKPVPELDGMDSYRDEYDFLLLRLAFNRQLPIFGICRGHQLINVAFGGSLYQDIHSQFSKDALKHSQDEARNVVTHKVTLTEIPSKLRKALNNPASPDMYVNSFHHQGVKDLAPEFVATATSPDGLNEAMEHPEYPVFSVQWHPEHLAVAGNDDMLNLFRYHVNKAAVFAEAKRLHNRIITVDSHTDTPMIFTDFDLCRKEGGKVNIPLMEEGRIDAAFMVAYVPQGERDDASLQKATGYALGRLSKIIDNKATCNGRFGIARTPEDLARFKSEGKKSILLGIENGYAIGKNLNNLQRFKSLGVSYITLCHNGDNDICDSAAGRVEWGGLSPFGRDVVAEMNRLGIMIDVSHASDSTFYDVLKYSKKPVIASHSSSRALCNNRRNLDDDQIRALASVGGVVQVCLYKGFINEDPEKASVSDAIEHILHIIDVAGIDHVGIGSDFDGDGELIGCRAANELIQITMRLIADDGGLLRRLAVDDSIAKIWGGNLLRVMREVQDINI
ncbi:MAG: membrane dipeptidase [Tannerella sp.]|jgi:microsomal dipeptidase-like Zn-dependent dipeptidase/gamma-glutamyl-gamma-aminobutyrate hydrolase PuuD|nr:membrane dipeptidase [Tannerella sp.]